MYSNNGDSLNISAACHRTINDNIHLKEYPYFEKPLTNVVKTDLGSSIVEVTLPQGYTTYSNIDRHLRKQKEKLSKLEEQFKVRRGSSNM